MSRSHNTATLDGLTDPAIEQAISPAAQDQRMEQLRHWRDLAHERLIAAVNLHAALTSRLSKQTTAELHSSIVSAAENYHNAYISCLAAEQTAGLTVPEPSNA